MSLQACLNYGENNAKLVGFIAAKSFFLFFKTNQIFIIV